MNKLCCLVWLLLFGSHAFASETLTIAVASSLYPAMQQQVAAFEQRHDVSVRLISGSTGRLYNQILQGAPFDVFIAADALRPKRLKQAGKSLLQQDLGLGYLGVMSAENMPLDLQYLTSSAIQHIAIANPDVAPFGQLSKKILQEYGLWVALLPKFVYAQNALQAAMLLDKGVVDAGFIPVASDAHAIASIHYQAVLLADKASARLWFTSITPHHKTHSVNVATLAD